LNSFHSKSQLKNAGGKLFVVVSLVQSRHEVRRQVSNCGAAKHYLYQHSHVTRDTKTILTHDDNPIMQWCC